MKNEQIVKTTNKIKKNIDHYTDEDLLLLNNDLMRLYKYLTKKRDVVKFVATLNKKLNTKEFIIFTELSKIIDKDIAPFTDNYLKRNIYFIQIAIQEILDERNRKLIKFVNF